MTLIVWVKGIQSVCLFTRLFYCVCFLFFCPFFLFSFYFCIRPFVSLKSKQQLCTLLFIVDAKSGHFDAGIGLAYQWMRWHKTDCLLGTGNCTNEIHSLIINKWMDEKKVVQSEAEFTFTLFALEQVDKQFILVQHFVIFLFYFDAIL